MVSTSQLTPLDREKEALKRQHPGWRIWYVPHGGSMAIKRVTWCAQRLPLLNCGSPEELSEAIREAEAEHLAGAQARRRSALDSESSPLPAER